MGRRLRGGLVLVALVLCSCKSQRGGEASAISVEAGFDPTPPNAMSRAKVAAVTMPQIAHKSRFFMLRAMDNRTTVITTEALVDENAALAILTELIQRMIPVTDLCGYWETMSRAYSQSKTKVIIVVYTDGLHDGMPDDAATRIGAAAAQLAANPNLLGVIVAGTERDTRPEWTGLADMLAPLGHKLHVIPQAGTDPDAIMKAIKAIKAEAARH